MSAVSLSPSVPTPLRFQVFHGAGLARRVGQGLVARAVAYPDQFAHRYGRETARA